MKSKNKFKLNRKLFTIHSWCGLLLGIFYFIIAISGASIVFMEELNNVIYGDDIKIEIPADSEKLSYNQLLDAAKQQYPNATFISLSEDPKHPDHAWGMYAGASTSGWFDNGFYNLDYINPYTGKIVFKANSNGYHNVLAFLDSMHVSLRLGAGGTVIVGIACLAILISLITGFIIYRKSVLKVLTFKTRIKFRNWRTATSDLHRVIGTWALLINFCIFGTGLYMYYPVFTPQLWKDVSKSFNTPVVHPDFDVSLDSLFTQSTQIFPAMIPTGFSVACDTSRSIFIFGTTKEKLFLNQDNFATVTYDWAGKVKDKMYKTWKEMGAKEKFDNTYFTALHTGWAYGTTGKIIWTIFGFAPAFLSITGFMLWWRRKRKSNRINQTIQKQ